MSEEIDFLPKLSFTTVHCPYLTKCEHNKDGGCNFQYKRCFDPAYNKKLRRKQVSDEYMSLLMNNPFENYIWEKYLLIYPVSLISNCATLVSWILYLRFVPLLWIPITISSIAALPFLFMLLISMMICYDFLDWIVWKRKLKRKFAEMVEIFGVDNN